MAFYPDTNPFWNVVEKAALSPGMKLDFEGMKLVFPRTEHDILTYMYGDYMQMPPVEKRKTHYPYILDLGDGTVLSGEAVTDRGMKKT